MQSPYHEALRPQFHFTARKGWLNDPNGLVYYEGHYHLFFQHNPGATVWGDMHWGHAISRDLVHWTELPIALAPDKLGTVFSGCGIVDHRDVSGLKQGPHDPLLLFFTAAGGTSPESQGQPFTQCLAYSTDGAQTFQHWAHNPILAHIAGENRDPKVVWNAAVGKFFMVLFLDGHEFGLYASDNLIQWEHVQNITMPGCGECPDLFELAVAETGERKWVMTAANGHYLIGRFDGLHYVPESGPHPSDAGPNFYAVQTYSDIPSADGRRIQIPWMNGGKYPDMPFNQQMGFPCVLTLHDAPGGLRMHRYPIGEIETLWGEREHIRRERLRPGSPMTLSLNTDLVDVELEFEPLMAASVRLQVVGEEVVYHCDKNVLTYRDITVPLAPEDGAIHLRALRDRTSFELFGNHGAVSLSACTQPGTPQSVVITSEGDNALVRLVEARQLKSAWPE